MNKLHRPVLMLDKGFQAYDAMPVRDAFCKIETERATFVDSDYIQYSLEQWFALPIHNHDYIITGRDAVRVPEVMRFLDHKLDHSRSRVMFNRKNLYKRDGYRCQYCGCKPKPDEITVDHILPQSRGGLSSFTNCVLACLKCNLKKGDRTPEEAGMQLRRLIMGPDGIAQVQYYYRPVHPKWHPAYSLPKLSKFPESWPNFLQMKNDELYWYVELEM